MTGEKADRGQHFCPTQTLLDCPTRPQSRSEFTQIHFNPQAPTLALVGLGLPQTG